jgi:cytochrome c-type biogenesis protein CcmH
MKRLIITLTALVLSSGVYAVQPDERLADANLEQRAREVSKALRCVVCQNETIDDSSAELARDMRILVRARITAGDSNEQVLAYMVQSYGDFVLLKPRLTPDTLILWFGPLLVLIIGGVVTVRRLRKPAAAAPAELNEDDARALKAMTGKGPLP